MLPRVRVRSQTIETKLVENLEGLDVLLAPRGGAAGGALACSHARHRQRLKQVYSYTLYRGFVLPSSLCGLSGGLLPWRRFLQVH